MTEQQPSSPMTPPEPGGESATFFEFVNVVLLRDDLTPTEKNQMIAAAATGDGASGQGVLLHEVVVARRLGGLASSESSVKKNLARFKGTWFHQTSPPRVVPKTPADPSGRQAARYALRVPNGSIAAFKAAAYPKRAVPLEDKNEGSWGQNQAPLGSMPTRESAPVSAVVVPATDHLPSAEGIDSKDLATIMTEQGWTRDHAVRYITQKRSIANGAIGSLPAYIRQCVTKDGAAAQPTLVPESIREVLAKQGPSATARTYGRQAVQDARASARAGIRSAAIR